MSSAEYHGTRRDDVLQYQADIEASPIIFTKTRAMLTRVVDPILDVIIVERSTWKTLCSLRADLQSVSLNMIAIVNCCGVIFIIK